MAERSLDRIHKETETTLQEETKEVRNGQQQKEVGLGPSKLGPQKAVKMAVGSD